MIMIMVFFISIIMIIIMIIIIIIIIIIIEDDVNCGNANLKWKYDHRRGNSNLLGRCALSCQYHQEVTFSYLRTNSAHTV